MRTRSPWPIVNGQIPLPHRSGLGVEPDMEAIELAHALYLKCPTTSRDDARAMLFLLPGWRFDPKRRCLVR